MSNDKMTDRNFSLARNRANPYRMGKLEHATGRQARNRDFREW